MPEDDANTLFYIVIPEDDEKTGAMIFSIETVLYLHQGLLHSAVGLQPRQSGLNT